RSGARSGTLQRGTGKFSWRAPFECNLACQPELAPGRVARSAGARQGGVFRPARAAPHLAPALLCPPNRSGTRGRTKPKGRGTSMNKRIPCALLMRAAPIAAPATVPPVQAVPAEDKPVGMSHNPHGAPRHLKDNEVGESAANPTSTALMTYHGGRVQ